MPIRGVDLSNLLSPRAPLYAGAPAALQGVQFMKEQQRLKGNAEAERALRSMQEQRLIAQGNAANAIRQQQMEAQKRLAESQAAQAQARLQHDQDKETNRRDDDAFRGLYDAVKSGDQELIDANVQNLGRLGYQVETAGGVSPAAVAAPTPEAEPEKSVDKPKKKGPVKPMLADPTLMFRSSEETSLRPQAARSGIEQPGMAAASQELPPTGDPVIDEIRSRRQMRKKNAAAGIGREKPVEPAEPVEAKIAPNPYASEQKPPESQAPKAGVRIRDRSGRVVLEFDPKAIHEKRSAAAVGSTGVLEAGARDEEEKRAALMARAAAEQAIQMGSTPEEAAKSAREAYEFELDRLGKKRQYGGAGDVPSPAGLSKKEMDRRFEQIHKSIGQNETVNKIAKLNEDLAQSGAIIANADGKTGLQHLVALTTIVKQSQGGRVSDQDMRQAQQSLGAIARAKALVSRYAGEGQLPEEALNAIRQAEKSVSSVLKQRKISVARATAENVMNNPDIKYVDDEDRRKVGLYVANSIAGTEGIGYGQESGTVSQFPSRQSAPAGRGKPVDPDAAAKALLKKARGGR